MKVGDLVRYPATVARGCGIGIVTALGKKRGVCRIAMQAGNRYVVFTQAAVKVISEGR